MDISDGLLNIVPTRKPLIRLFAERAVERVEGLRIVDYCLCLSGGYVVVEGARGRAMGFAHIPHEDLHDVGDVKIPKLEDMPEFVIDIKSIEQSTWRCYVKRRIAIPPQ